VLVADAVESVEVAGLLLTVVSVEPVLIVSGETSPNAPETNRPSAKRATRASGTLR
jgi:hypothetical protein